MNEKEHKNKLIKLPTKQIKEKDILNELRWFNKIGFVLPTNKKGISTFYIESLKTVYKTQGQVWEHFNNLEPHLKCIALYALTNWGLLFNKDVKKQSQMLLIGKCLNKSLRTVKRGKQHFYKQCKGQLNLMQVNGACKVTLSSGAGLLTTNGKHQLFNGNNILSNTYFNVNGILGNEKTHVAFFNNYTKFTLKEKCILYSLYNGLNENADIYMLKISGEGEVNINSKLQTFLNTDSVNVKVNNVVGKFIFFAFSDDVKMQYGSNVCKGDNLELYANTTLNLKKNEEIIIHFCISFNNKKPETNFINLLSEKAACCQVMQKLIGSSHIASNLPVNMLKTKIKAFNEVVKTSFLPTVVLENLKYIENIIPFAIKFNVVLLDSSINLDEAKKLIDNGIFVYNFNRNEINPNALHYFSLLYNCDAPKQMSQSVIPKEIEIKTEISNTLPKVHTTTLTNTNKKIQKATLCCTYQTSSQNAGSILPLPKLIEKQGNTISITSQLTGKTSVIKSNVPCSIGTERSLIAAQINIQTPIKLCGFEQLVIKHKFVSSSQISKSVKHAFLSEITNIQIESQNKLLNEQLANPDSRIDVLEKIIGVRLVKGRIELNPKTKITGSFVLSFESGGQPYTFRVNVKDEKFSVDYNNVNYQNVNSFKLG